MQNFFVSQLASGSSVKVWIKLALRYLLCGATVRASKLTLCRSFDPPAGQRRLLSGCCHGAKGAGSYMSVCTCGEAPLVVSSFN